MGFIGNAMPITHSSSQQRSGVQDNFISPTLFSRTMYIICLWRVVSAGSPRFIWQHTREPYCLKKVIPSPLDNESESSPGQEKAGRSRPASRVRDEADIALRS